MIIKNTPDRYGAVHKTLHWLIALFVLMMLVMGLVMGDIPNGPDKFWVYSIHKSLGITILALMLARVAWKFANWHRPHPLPTHKRWERLLAGAVHWGLYALLIAMPLTGWLMTGAKGSTINWFGFGVIPNLNGVDRDLGDLFEEAHELIALGIWGLIGLHIAGALKHTIIDRDNTLRRMVPFGAFMLMMVPAIALADDEATAWTINRETSALTITATQEGGPFTGKFVAFDGTITFDPEQPETGKAVITIDLNTFESGNEQRDASVKEKDWFDIPTFPTATYRVASFVKGTEKDTYIAKGTLFLRGIERPLDLPFTLSITEENDVRTAHAVGKTTLQRLEFDVGGGDWKDEAMVGNDVTVQIDLYATAKDK